MHAASPERPPLSFASSALVPRARQEPWAPQTASEVEALILAPHLPAGYRLGQLVHRHTRLRWVYPERQSSGLHCEGLLVRTVRRAAAELGLSASACSRALQKAEARGELCRSIDVEEGLVLSRAPLSPGALLWDLKDRRWRRFQPTPSTSAATSPEALPDGAGLHADRACAHADRATTPPPEPRPIKERARAVDPQVELTQISTTPQRPPTPSPQPPSPADAGVGVDPPAPLASAPIAPSPRTASPQAPPQTSKARRPKARRQPAASSTASPQAARLLRLAEPLPTPCQVPPSQLREALQRRGFDAASLDDLLPVLTQLLTREHLRDLLAAFDKQAATPRGVLQPRALLLTVTRNILTQNTASTPRELCPSLRAFRASPHTFHLQALEQHPEHAHASGLQTHDTTPSTATPTPPPQPAPLRCSLEELEPEAFDHAFAQLDPFHQEMALRFAQPHLLRLALDDDLPRDTEALERQRRYVVAAQLRGVVP